MPDAGIATSAPNFTLQGVIGYPDTSVPFLYVSSSTQWSESARKHLQAIDRTSRRTIAKTFAAHVHGDPLVREVWYTDAEQEAMLTLLVSEASLEDELRYEAVLAGVLPDGPTHFPGFLRVYSEAEGIPESAREGERLLP